ncbi:MAG: hypothetical protein H6618_00690 [Deltaproteobacteria bacterium]|nr:hypothetical protein [Deltaproteobacteria bacterium]
MLKHFRLDTKTVPVPVPLTNLNEAMEWVEHTFIRQNTVMTSATIDGQDVLSIEQTKWPSILLDDSSLFEVVLDSPREISIQTAEAIRDLSQSLLARLQAIAVKCWEADSDVYLAYLREVSADLDLIRDLITHISGIVDYTHKEMAPVSGLGRLLRYPVEDLRSSVKACKWKDCAHILLNRIEPLLHELVPESERLHIRIISSEDDHAMIPERRF